jgi:transposase
MGYIVGEGRSQGSLFPVALDDLVPADHMCRVVDAFVASLDVARLGFGRAHAADTGRPGYDPRDLLKLYLYGYLQQVRSSRRLEAECRRNVELMWLLGRLYPDHKAISEFRRLHSEAVTAAGAQLIEFARSVGLIRGEWVAIDGSKFRAASSARGVREREAMARYLATLEQADGEDEIAIDATAVATALEKLKAHREPEARFMRTAGGAAPAYNVQTAVDAEHALIVAQQVTTEAADNRSLQPMAQAARAALGNPQTLKVVADAGYSNGQQARACEEQGIVAHVPANRAINNQGDGALFDRSAFTHDPTTDTVRCPAHHQLRLKQQHRKQRLWIYAAEPAVCGACALKPACTATDRRFVTRHFDDDVLTRMDQRATPELMRLRRSIVEHPFGTLKYRIFGHPRFLLRGRRGAQTEISLAVIAYNLKRMINLLGTVNLSSRLATA